MGIGNDVTIGYSVEDRSFSSSNVDIIIKRY